jgi:hypothetical protein
MSFAFALLPQLVLASLFISLSLAHTRKIIKKLISFLWLDCFLSSTLLARSTLLVLSIGNSFINFN